MSVVISDLVFAGLGSAVFTWIGGKLVPVISPFLSEDVQANLNLYLMGASMFLSAFIFLKPSAMGSGQSGEVMDVCEHEKLSCHGSKSCGTGDDFNHKPRLPLVGPGSGEFSPPMTIPQVFEIAVLTKKNRPVMAVERPLPPAEGLGKASSLPWDQWTKWTYQDYMDETRTAAKAFMACGVQQFGTVNVFGYNSPEWFIACMGAIFTGGKCAGIYPTDTSDQVAFKAQHSGANVAVVETLAHLKKFTENIDMCTDLNAIVVWAEDPKMEPILRKNGTSIKIMSWKDFMALGNSGTVSDDQLNDRLLCIEPGHCAALIYTSGTTGNPKAVMCSHDNFLFESRMVLYMLKNIIGQGEERLISYLPLSHVAGMMVDIICPVVGAAFSKGFFTVYFARPYDLKDGTIGARLTFVKPTMFLGVPRVWEKIAEKMKAVGASTKGLKKMIAMWAKYEGLASAKAKQHNTTAYFKGWNTPLLPVADKIVLSKVKTALGLECCKFAFTGAAPITVDTLEYFGSLGIQINEVYGMSECCGATTFSSDEKHIWGSCGFSLPGMETKVFKCDEQDFNKKIEVPVAKDMFQPTEEEQGEICFRGRHIMMGYLANPKLGPEHVEEINKKTHEAIDDEGWLHSGDKGCIGEGGFFRITGRYKELIIGAGGENIAPVPMEDNIKKLCDAVSNVMMVGDKRKYNTCVVTLKAVGATGELPGSDDLMGPALKVDPNITKISQAREDKGYKKHIEDAIKKTNNDPKICQNNAWKIQKFRILPRDFSVQTDELTPTLKLKRSVACKLWNDIIEEMYVE